MANTSSTSTTMTTRKKKGPATDSASAGATQSQPRMKTKEYEKELRRLHGELVAMQEWVKATGAKVCVVFEGRDTAGKGGTIKAITERVSPRVFRVIALPAPTEREKSQMYAQRYFAHFPAAGEVVIFDRSWYNRAGVERVMGFCTPEQTESFLRMTPGVERAMVDSGIILIKYWLDVSPDEQTRRLRGRINDPRKVWKLSDMDVKSYKRWDDYSLARDDMFRATHTAWAPWHVAVTDDKKRGRLNSSPTCSARCPTSRSSHATSSSRSGTSATTPPPCRCATSPHRSDDPVPLKRTHPDPRAPVQSFNRGDDRRGHPAQPDPNPAVRQSAEVVCHHCRDTAQDRERNCSMPEARQTQRRVRRSAQSDARGELSSAVRSNARPSA
jgi:polyphosphate kinase 2